MADARVGDYGDLTLRTTFVDKTGDARDLSGATSVTLWFIKPDGTKVSHAASAYTDGSDGIFDYTFESGDSTPAGEWVVDGLVETVTGKVTSAKGRYELEDPVNSS